MGGVKDWLRSASERAPGAPFLVVPGGSSYSFGEVEEMTRRVVGALEGAGIGPGDRVALRPDNDAESVARMFAIPRTGATTVMINARLSEPEILWQLAHASVSSSLGRVPGAEELPAEADPVEGREIDPDRDYVIVFTSGSTGRPKGVRLTWRNLEASAAGSAAHLDHRPADRWYCALPLYHVGGMSIPIRSARQASSVALEPSFDAGRAADLMRDGAVSLGSVVPAMLRQILETDPGPYRGVRALLVGGGRTSQSLLDEAAEAGLPVLPTYGMTETASQVATLPLDDGLHPSVTAVPVPGAEIRLGPRGVIEVKGPMVSPGYLDGPGTGGDGWFRTSDAGEIRNSRLTVLGRVDDVIVSGGENVHPSEIESVLSECEGVEDVAVVGVPHPRWGEEIVAVIEGEANPGPLERYARYHLAGYKIPKRWLMVDALPRLPVGKIDRVRVREMVSPSR